MYSGGCGLFFQLDNWFWCDYFWWLWTFDIPWSTKRNSETYYQFFRSSFLLYNRRHRINFDYLHIDSNTACLVCFSDVVVIWAILKQYILSWYCSKLKLHPEINGTNKLGWDSLFSFLSDHFLLYELMTIVKNYIVDEHR